MINKTYRQAVELAKKGRFSDIDLEKMLKYDNIIKNYMWKIWKLIISI
jgi:hypothetical protein